MPTTSSDGPTTYARSWTGPAAWNKFVTLLIATLGPEAEESYVTTAEMLRAEGEARGEARGRAKALVQVLTLKFGPLPQPALDTMHAASIDQLETWTARVLTADTLDEVLRSPVQPLLHKRPALPPAAADATLSEPRMLVAGDLLPMRFGRSRASAGRSID